MQIKRFVLEMNLEGEPFDDTFYVVGKMKVSTKRGIRDIEKTVTVHKTVKKSDLVSNFDVVWDLIGEDIKREIEYEKDR